MNKEFIPYEQALALEELGFDEKNTLAYYNIEDKRLINGYSLSTNGFELSTPLYQQAFRWFRDVHGLNGVIEGSKKHGFEWCIFPDLDYYMKPPNNFNTYEEAETACLRRLIDIVKDQKS